MGRRVRGGAAGYRGPQRGGAVFSANTLLGCGRVRDEMDAGACVQRSRWEQVLKQYLPPHGVWTQWPNPEKAQQTMQASSTNPRMLRRAEGHCQRGGGGPSYETLHAAATVFKLYFTTLGPKATPTIGRHRVVKHSTQISLANVHSAI